MGTVQNTMMETIVEPTAFDKNRWANLGDSLIALGNILQQQSSVPTLEAQEQAKELYGGIYQQVCRFCSKTRWCWGEEAAYTMEELSGVCNQMASQGLRKESAFSTKFQGRCMRSRQLEVALFNQIVHTHERLQIQAQYQANKEIVSQQLILLGEQMKLMRQSSARADTHKERLLVGHAGSRKESISGDSWDVLDLQDGRLVQILCDGMGSGAIAMEQSSIAVKLLQSLLSGGLSVRLSLSIMNTVLSMQYGGGRFSTADVAVWNLNSGKVELYKYGAAPSFVRNGRQVRTYMSESLPVGILPRVEGTITEHRIQQGDLLIMMSDGLYELTSSQFQWEEVIRRMPPVNPQLMAEYLLAIATSRSRGNQKQAEAQDEKALEADDMTILVSKLV